MLAGKYDGVNVKLDKAGGLTEALELTREAKHRGFQVMVGGTVLSALVHPWFYALAAFDLANHAFLAQPALLGLPVWLIASLSLGAGYLASMAVAFLALKQRGARQLFKQVPLMPLYWLLISGAAYRAIWQFMTDRFAWEKTEHGLSRFMTKAAAP